MRILPYLRLLLDIPISNLVWHRLKIVVPLLSIHTANVLLTIQVLHPYRLSISSINHFSNDCSFSHAKDFSLKHYSLNFLEYFSFLAPIVKALVFSFKYKLFRVRFDVV